MPILLHHRVCRRVIALLLTLCILLPGAVDATPMKENWHDALAECGFSVLIMGDSQMAGDGWEGGYANCILEAYPNAQVFNLAVSGSLLANGDIHEQWAFYLSEDLPAFDFVLLDGGINDLPYLQREEFKDNGMAMVKEAFCSLVEQIHEANQEARIIYTMMPPFAEWKNSDHGPPSFEIQERFWKQMHITASAYDYVTVLDLFSINPFHFPCTDCYQEYFADSVHLNEAGYRKTYEHIDHIISVYLALK